MRVEPAADVAPAEPARARRSLPYLPSIDGLRAVAVVAVILYHLELGDGRFAGGYLGVEVFFVVSGYLITSLLLHEHGGTGAVDLKGFWARRARRLMPAVWTMIVAVVVVTAVAYRGDLAILRGDALASLLYVQNWHAIFTDQPYFATFGRPSPLQHLWSLSIEEQIYVIWPLGALLAARFLSRRGVLLVVLGGAALSVFQMARLADVLSVERAYYGTDTRAFPLLFGGALAVVYRPGRRFVDSRGKHAPWAIDVLALLALIALVVQLDRRSEFDPWTFPEGFLWIDALTLMLIVSSATVGSKVAKVLSIGPLVAIGRRSYSLYLWHWPVFVFTRPGIDVGLTGWPVQVLRLGLACALAEVSYRFVEQPFRHGRAQQRVVGWWRARERRQKIGVAVGSTVVVLALVATTMAARPENPETEGVDVPMVALPETTTTVPPTTTTTTEAPPTTEALDPNATTTSTETTVPETTTPPPPPDVVAEPISAFGDSVMLGASPGLAQRFSGMNIDAVVGRQVSEVIDEVRTRASDGTLDPTVIVHLGNNGAIPNGALDELRDIVGDRHLILVTVSVPRRWESQVNDTLRGFVDEHPDVTLVDWGEAASGRDDLKVSDGVHLNSNGVALYSEMLAEAVRSR